MKTRVVEFADIQKGIRIDAGHFLSPGVASNARLAKMSQMGVPRRQLGGVGGLGRVSLPKRFKRVYSSLAAGGAPYLRPSDLLEFLPEAADYLSRTRNDIPAYSVDKGTILVTCSGRNLGPAVYVDEYLARFVVSHDMVRVHIDDERMRLYTLAFLNSQNGQALLRSDKTGSVIDHIDDLQVAEHRIPLLEEHVDEVVELMAKATETREKARLGILESQVNFNERLAKLPEATSRYGWTTLASDLGGRIDAANHHPVALAARSSLLQAGGVLVEDVADVVKPAGRYKTIYVDREWGQPMLSGRQIHHVHPLGLKFMALKALKAPDRYQLTAHSIVYQADGRAEEKLGLPAMVTPDRHGWMASGHVGRVVPRLGIDSGWLYLALGSSPARIQIKAKASGSVVDGTYENDMAKILLPPPASHPEVVKLWDLFSDASQKEYRAESLIDRAFAAVDSS